MLLIPACAPVLHSCMLAVQTGKYLPGDEAKHGVEPFATVPDFAAAVDLLVDG